MQKQIQKKVAKKDEDEDEYDGIFDQVDAQVQGQQLPKPQTSAKKEKSKKDQFIFEDGQYYMELTSKKRVCISQFRNQTMISIREYYEKNGEMLPTKKGIALTVENWNKLKEAIDSIDECIKKI